MANTGAQQTIAFELVSPERKLVSEPVRMAVIPGEAGEFGVGAGHTSLLASLRPGVVKLYKDNDNTPDRRIFIAGGFADVTATLCTVLAEEAVNLDDLKQADIEQDIRNLNEDLIGASEEIDRLRITRQIALAKAKLQAITGKIEL